MARNRQEEYGVGTWLKSFSGLASNNLKLMSVASKNLKLMSVFFIVYVDDGIFLGNRDKQLRDVIQELESLGLDVDDQGHPADYIDVNISKTKDGYYQFSQRSLIENIIEGTPAKSTLLLHAFKNSKKFDLNFNYQSSIVKVHYLAQTKRPNIMYAIHQAAKYSTCLK